MTKQFIDRFGNAKSVKLMIVAGVLLLGASGAAYWQYIYTNPTRVFDRMLASSLASSSVTKAVSQADDSQKLDQVSTLMTLPKQQVHAVSVLAQGGAGDKTNITTESIGTPVTEFVRYSEIKTGQKSADGKPFNFSKVLGIWGKSDQKDPSGEGVQLFNQTLLGAVPIANLPQPTRVKLLNQIRESGVYKIDGSAVKKQMIDGRQVYTYDVVIAPVAYVSMLKSFAAALGLKQLEQVDPNQYAKSAPLKLGMSVDVWSGQLTRVLYKDSSRKEVLTSYGTRVPVELPTSSIPVADLQSRLQQIK